MWSLHSADVTVGTGLDELSLGICFECQGLAQEGSPRMHLQYIRRAMLGL